MAKRIIPQGGRLLIKPLPEEDVTLGSIILPGGTSGQLKEGIAQDGLDLIDPSRGVHYVIKKGDKLLYPTGQAVGQRNGAEWFDWVPIGEIWGIVEEDTAPEDKGDDL